MIGIGCDHGGFELKEYVKKYLEDKGVEVRDFGSYTPERCDYPIVAETVARAVVAGEVDKGILICGTGIGVSIAANKVLGVRAALCGDCYSAEYTGSGLACKIVDTFLETGFDGSYHADRVALISDIERRERA